MTAQTEAGKIQMKVEIRRNSDGVIAVEVWPDWQYNTFWWADGNASCDCNRELFFLRARKENDDIKTVCGGDRFNVRISNAETGEVLYNEFQDAAPGKSMIASTEAKSVTTLRDISFGGPGDTLIVRFDQTGTFAAMHAAEKWCRKHGVSYGPSDRSRTQGLLVGDYMIAKWHNLTAKEKRECHGTITGDGQEGPLVLRISRSALAGAKS